MAKKGKKDHKNRDRLSIRKKGPLPYRIVFVALILFSTLFFLNKLLKSPGYANSLQAVIYVGLIGVFGYLGWESFSKDLDKKRLLIVSLVGFVLISAIYILAFDPVLGTGGDNAHYISIAKSLSSFQGYRDPTIPGHPPDMTRAPVLPFFLAPVIKFFGINIIALKMVPLCLAIFSIIIVFFFFKNYLILPFAIIITLLASTNHTIISLSRDILAEIPFLFFSMLALFLLLKFEKQEKVMGKYCFLAGFFVVVVYWTRWAGLAFLVTSILYFVLKKNYKKALALGIVILAFFLIWRIRCMTVETGGASQFGLFANWVSDSGEHSFLSGAIEKTITNLKIAANVMPQNIFNHRLMAWEVLRTNLWIVVVLAFIIVGYLWHLICRRSQMDLYVPAIMVAPILTSIPSSMNISRYFIPIVPFLIYYFFTGINLLFRQLEKLGVPKYAGNTGILFIMSLVLFFQLLGDNERIEYAHRSEPYSPAYIRFLDTAYWAKDNTATDAYFAVRKPHTFYLFSDRHISDYCGKGVDNSDVWSREREEKLLSMYEEKDIDYIVLDRFSSSAHRLIYLIIRNNPDKFQVVYVTKKPETYVFKINKWWK